MTRKTTSELVASLATKAGAIDPDQRTVIGLFGPEQALQALVREPSGQLRRIKPGQTLGSARVVGIDPTGLMLETNGLGWRLALAA